MYCDRCGFELPDNATLCAECGNDVGSEHAHGSDAGSRRELELHADPEIEASADFEPESGSDASSDDESDEESGSTSEIEPDEEAPGQGGFPEIETMTWSADSIPRVEPASAPEEPRLERIVIVSIAVIGVAFAALIIVAAFHGVLTLLSQV